MKIKIIAQFLILILISTSAVSQNLSGVRIYINPGHGGYDSDDRNIVIAPFKSGDPEGFWESKSNLDKGQSLKEMLDKQGATTFISRTQNRTEDDLPLSQIVRSANEANVDFMLSIHSNAGNGVANHVLMLYAGVDPGDTETYPSPTPYSDKSRVISTEIANNLFSNQVNVWSAGLTVRGDKTFGRTAMGWNDGYGVLRGLTVPGVISEGSMHDYIPEAYRLMNMEYKWLEAWHFLKAFTTYFKSAELANGNVAGYVRDKFMKHETSYFKIPSSSDGFLPVNNAIVTLMPGNIKYEVDDMNNGFFLFKDIEPGNYSLTIEHPQYHVETASVVVEKNKTTYVALRPNMIRNTPPEVIDFSPKALSSDTVMLASSVVRFKFNWDIDPQSAKNAFHISPNVSGKFNFKEANYVMEFVPDVPLDTSTVYTILLDKSLSHFDGLSMSNDFSFSFKTANRNKLLLLATYPMKNEENIHYKTPTFTFVFDKKLATAELITGVQVYDMNGRQLTKNVRSLKHNTFPEPLGSTLFTLGEDLKVGERYVVKIAQGIKDIDGVFLTDTIEIPFKTSDVRVENRLVVQSFETDNLISVDAASSTNLLSATVSRNTSTKLFGSSSWNLKYSFKEKSGGTLICPFANPNIVVNNDSVIGMHILGDLSGNEIYLIFNAGVDVKEVKLDSIHYGGWKFVEKTLKELNAGEAYMLSGIKIRQTDAPVSSIGNLFVDNCLVNSKLLNSSPNNSASSLQVYPIPASNELFVRVESDVVKQISLFSLQGQLLKTSHTNRMSVSDMPEGMYLIRVMLNEGIVSKSVMIKR